MKAEDAAEIAGQRRQVGLIDRNPRQMGDLAGLVLGDRHEFFPSLRRGIDGGGSTICEPLPQADGACKGRRDASHFFREGPNFSTCTPRGLCLNTASRRRQDRQRTESGPFVYRLGRQVFNLERGVRLPYGLPLLPLICCYQSSLASLLSSAAERWTWFAVLRTRYLPIWAGSLSWCRCRPAWCPCASDRRRSPMRLRWRRPLALHLLSSAHEASREPVPQRAGRETSCRMFGLVADRARVLRDEEQAVFRHMGPHQASMPFAKPLLMNSPKRWRTSDGDWISTSSLNQPLTLLARRRDVRQRRLQQCRADQVNAGRAGAKADGPTNSVATGTRPDRLPAADLEENRLRRVELWDDAARTVEHGAGASRWARLRHGISMLPNRRAAGRRVGSERPAYMPAARLSLLPHQRPGAGWPATAEQPR